MGHFVASDNYQGAKFTGLTFLLGEHIASDNTHRSILCVW